MVKKVKKEKIGDVVIDCNDENFEENVIEKSKKVPVVVDFWADWCMPCAMLSPVLGKLAKEYKGEFVLCKVNIDEGRAIAEMLGIMSIPAVIMFKDGKQVDMFLGAMPESEVRKWLDKNLG